MHVYQFSANQINQIFHYTRCITLKRVTSFRGPSPRHCACGQHNSLRRNVAAVANRWKHCDQLTGPSFEPQTSRSRDKRVTARPTDLFFLQNKESNYDCYCNVLQNFIAFINQKKGLR